MKKFFGIFVIIYAVLFQFPAGAQILDDEDINHEEDLSSLADEAAPLDETDANEAYFNELFSDYSETERDVTKIKTFDDAMDKASEFVKIVEDINNHPPKDEDLPPLEGDILIGISRGSFNLYKNAIGKPECSFYVTMKSNLNREIKTLGVNLVYPFVHYAFIFRNVKPNEAQEQPMRMMGYPCYQMSEVPDLDVNYCKIRTASGKECVQRLKWVKNIEPPKVEKDDDELYW